MAHASVNNSDEDYSFYSSSHSDDSPILSYRHEKRRYVAYTSPSAVEDRERRSTFSILWKFCFFCAAMILFCVLMYIPVYNKANYHIPKGFVAGWSIHTNRDTKLYVQPNNVTTIHEPSDVCPSQKKLFLLIVVCSATENFDHRKAIRDTWGNYGAYLNNLKLFKTIKDRYKNYDFKQDLYVDIKLINNTNKNISDVESATKRVKRDTAGFSQLLPALAKALKYMNVSKTEEVPEKRFEDEDDVNMLSQFDMNKEIGTETDNIQDYDVDYESNIMKIPPRGYEDTFDFPHIKINVKEDMVDSNTEPEFKVVFLLGLPSKNNKTVQRKIEEEVIEFGDVIQEGFIDSYNNLTLKSIMMLKWVTNRCNESVRYILKVDDDTYVNMPNLMEDLHNRSRQFDEKVAAGYSGKEYMLIGDLIVKARPSKDKRDKWYAPQYMYNGRVYPRYLSGTGYALSAPAARALYRAALTTHYFHLEDVYITGMCSLRAKPRITPVDDPLYVLSAASPHLPTAACCAHSQVTAHRIALQRMRNVHDLLWQPAVADRCERIRLTQVRRERLRRLRDQKKALTLAATGRHATNILL